MTTVMYNYTLYYVLPPSYKGIWYPILAWR